MDQTDSHPLLDEFFRRLLQKKATLDDVRGAKEFLQQRLEASVQTTRLMAETQLAASVQSTSCDLQTVAYSPNTVLLTLTIENRFNVTISDWTLAVNVDAMRLRIWETSLDKDVTSSRFYFITLPKLKAGEKCTIELKIDNSYQTSLCRFAFCLARTVDGRSVKTLIFDYAMHVLDAMVSYSAAENEKRMSVKDYQCMANFKPRLDSSATSSTLTCSFSIHYYYLERKDESETIESCALRLFLHHCQPQLTKDGYQISVDNDNYIVLRVTGMDEENRYTVHFDCCGPEAEYVAQAVTEAVLWRLVCLIRNVSQYSKPLSLKRINRAVKVKLPWNGEWTTNCYLNPTKTED